MTVKRKDTLEEKVAKDISKRARQATFLTDATTKTCKSCKEFGHASARSKQCRNYNFTINELIEQKMGPQYQRYTVSLPLKSFIRTLNDDTFNATLSRIQSLSLFVREVVFKAQLFINYYILQHPQTLSNDFFQQNFWYSLCRVINGNMEITEFAQKYSRTIPQLNETWNELQNSDNIDLRVNIQGLKNYGQALSDACETVATCYNNYYIENFENIISNYFIYKLRSSFDVSYIE